MDFIQNNVTKNEISHLDPSSVESALQDLTSEANKVFKILDTASATIRKLENSLSNIKAHFPFKFIIKEEAESFLKPALEKHAQGFAGTIHGFFTKDVWALSWEKHDTNNDFRLFLVIEEVESIFFDYAENIEQIEKFSSELKLKRPLIETDIPTRLKCSAHLIAFINAFTSYLQSYHTAITSEPLPF